MLRLFLSLAVYFLLIPGLLVSGEKHLKTIRVKAVVPEVLSMDIPGIDGWGVKSIQGTLSDENATVLEFPNAIQVREILCNSAIYMQVRLLSWTPPPALQAYPYPSPPLHELQLRVNQPWVQRGHLSAVAAYSAYGGIDQQASDVLKIGDKRVGGTMVGCHMGSVDMDARLVFADGEAEAGTYVIDLEITVRSQP